MICINCESKEIKVWDMEKNHITEYMCLNCGSIFAPYKTTKIEKLLKKIEYHKNCIDDLEIEIGEKFVQEKIKPFCDKYKIDFIVGNGTYIFTYKDKILKICPVIYRIRRDTTFFKWYYSIEYQIDKLYQKINLCLPDYKHK